MKYALLLTLLPALLWAQEFEFRQEYDTIPVEIDGWQPFSPWMGGLSKSTPEFCDLDGDEDLDLFCGDGMGYVAYFKNTGTPSSADFQLETYQFEPFYSTADISFADIDNDGDEDVLFGYWCYYNSGSATQFNFQSPGDSLFDTSGNLLLCPRMATVDINSDSDIDIFAGQYSSGEIRFYENIGSPEQYLFQLTAESWLGIVVSGGVADPTFCDLDADDDYDLFIGERYGKIWYYRNDGDSVNYDFTLVTDNYADIDVGDYASPEFADIDGDGDYDLFVGRDNQFLQYSPGDIFFYENLGTQTIPQWILRTKNYLSLDEGYAAKNNSTDIDDDAAIDIFLMNQGDHLSYFANVGDSAMASYMFRTGSYQDLTVESGSPCFADIDADQDVDLFIGEALVPNPPYPGLHLFQNIGTPQNAAFSLYSSNLVPYSFDVAIRPTLADIDADGDKDLFIRDNDGVFYFYENIGTAMVPQFASPILNWQGLTMSGSHWSCFYDIDADGDLDYFVTMGNWENDDLIGFYRNMGTAQVPNLLFQTNSFLTLESGKFILEGIDILDIDHDGDGDFLLGTAFNGGMLFFRNVTGETPSVPPLPRTAPYRGPVLSVGPNPANPVTVLSFELRVASSVSLAVYDVSGRKVAELLSGRQEAGAHVVTWDASGLGSGVYLARLQVGTETQAGKVVVVK